jgi:hypothetical protein
MGLGQKPEGGYGKRSGPTYQKAVEYSLEEKPAANAGELPIDYRNRCLCHGRVLLGGGLYPDKLAKNLGTHIVTRNYEEKQMPRHGKGKVPGMSW